MEEGKGQRASFQARNKHLNPFLEELIRRAEVDVTTDTPGLLTTASNVHVFDTCGNMGK